MLQRTQKLQFAAAIRRMLRPVVRQLIAYGVTFPVLNQMLRHLYVEVAEADFALPFKRQTDSRLALVTGLNRKEVAQLREQRDSRDDLPELEDTLVTHVIGRWMAGPPYASPDGLPRRLAYESDDSAAPSFHRLVGDLGVDIPVRAVLDELISLGAAELLPDGNVALRQEGHIAPVGAEAKLALIGSDPSELFCSIVHNVEHPGQPWFQRKVVYDNIGAEALEQLQAEARRLGEEFMRRANALLGSYDRDRHPDAPTGARARVVLGAYYFEEQTDSSAPHKSAGREAPAPGRIRRSR